MASVRNAVGHLRLSVLGVLLLAAVAVGVPAQGNADGNSNSATPSPSATPTPIPIADVVAEADAASAKLQEIRAFLAGKPRNDEIRLGLPVLAERVEATTAETNKLLNSNPSLDELNTIEGIWQEIAKTARGWRSDLQDQAGELDQRISELNTLKDLWQRTLGSITGRPAAAANTAGNVNTSASTEVPDELLQRVNGAIASIDEVQKQAEERRSEILSLQARVSDRETRVTQMLESIRERRSVLLARLFIRDSPALWNVDWKATSASNISGEVGELISTRVALFREYAAVQAERFVSHAVIFLLFAAVLYWLRGRIAPFVEQEPSLERAASIFRHPILAGLLLSILVAGWIYPQAPRLLLTALGVAALIPVIVIVRRLVDRTLLIILYVLVGFFFFDRVRDLTSALPLVSRLASLAEMLAAVSFLIWFLRSKRLSSRVEARNFGVFAATRRIIPFALIVFSVAVLANIVGFVSLSQIIGNGVLRSSYAALILYTAVEIIDSLSLFALRMPPLANLGVVKNNRPVVHSTVMRIVRLIAILLWVFFALDQFSVRDAVVSFFSGILAAKATIGSIELSVGHLVAFVIAVWAAFLVSRFIRFVLEEDVYPRMELSGGASYAISSVVHYLLLTIGFLVAIAAIGVEVSKFTILAGAVGIGLGFGMQNIINNFVSGLILLFERPVKVGDAVQIGEHIGTLQQIGLRASIVRKVDGSDVIVPNSHLISEEVINWTMSDEKRRIDIAVGVAYGTDAKLVIELLTGVTAGKDAILTDPGPQVLFTGFGDNSIDFELRVWTDDPDGWVRLRSALVSDIYAALNEANIEIPFPQRDLHLRSVDRQAAAELGRKPE